MSSTKQLQVGGFILKFADIIQKDVTSPMVTEKLDGEAELGLLSFGVTHPKRMMMMFTIRESYCEFS